MREMKDSGIPYVGNIPSNWVQHPVYYYFYEGKNPNRVCKEKNLLSLSYGKVIRKDINTSEGLLPASFSTYNIVDANDIIIRPTDLQNDKRSLRTGLVKEHGIITSAYIDLKPYAGVNSHYYHYLLHAYDIMKVFYNMGNGVRQGLNYSEFSKLVLITPPSDEQEKIAAFLDKECSKIDSIYADVEKQIETLEQYKRSIITESVTKGLNPNVELKESGMKWIGRIPASWKAEKIKYHLRRNERRNPGNQQVLSVYREYGVIPKDSRDDNHNVTSEDVSKYKYVKPGYLVINKMKAWQGSMGISEYEGIVSPAYFIYEFSNDLFEKKYLHYLLRGCYKDEFRRISGGIREGQWDLSPEGFMNTSILIPSLNEQKEIVKYIDKKCAEIESVIADKKKQLEVLENYKKSLIYEYVTGKKEVVNE